MAKVLEIPNHLLPPIVGQTYDSERQQEVEEDAFISRLREHVWYHSNDSPDPDIGKIIMVPASEGHAFYMVAETRPLALIFVPIDNARRMEKSWERGLKVSKVKELIRLNDYYKAMRKKYHPDDCKVPMFRELDPEEEERFFEYARTHDPDMEFWESYHPACRKIWRGRGFAPV